jgi:hypothetical protein
MKKRESSAEHLDIFLLSMASLATLGLLAAAFAVSGVFFRPVVFLFAIPLLVATLFFLVRFISHETRMTQIAFVIALAVPIIFLSGTEPFLFSGRDQGSLAEASVSLAREGSLHSSSTVSDIFFRIYGAGAALHFPGFHYSPSGQLVTQFPIGTVSFFGSFVSLVGPLGLVVANGLLLFVSLFSLYLLVRMLADQRFALGTLLIGATSFLPLFVARFSLSENIFLALFLALSLAVSRFLQKPDRRVFLVSLALAALLSLIRIEGIFAFLATVSILIFSPAGRVYLARERSEFLLSTLILALLFLAGNLAANLPLYRSVLGATRDHLLAPGTGSGAGSSISLSLWRLFIPYGLFLPFLLGLLGIVSLAIRKRWDLLVPAFLALPAFLFFVDPNITPDHPWMLRRFLFSLWPTLFALFPVALFQVLGRHRDHVFGRATASIVFTLVLLLSLPATRSLGSFQEYEGLAEQTTALAGRIGERDLLLIDREAVGDPYAIPAAPLRLLHDRHAVYFFNPDDYAKIPEGTFEHVYLLAPEHTIDTLWHRIPADLILVDRITFSYDRFRPTPLAEPALPTREQVETESALFRLEPISSPTI